MITILLLLGVVVVIIYYYRNYVKQFEDIDKLPGPSTLQLIKDLYFNSSSKGIIDYFQSLNSIYGPVVKVWMKPFKPMIITNDMEYCNKIYKANDHYITPALFEITFMGEGIASNAHYENWKNDKSVMVKTITKSYINNKLNIYDQKYNELINAIRSHLGKPVDVEKYLHKILLEVLIETIQHKGINLTQQELKDYIKSRNDFFVLLMEKMNSFSCVGVLHWFTKNYRQIWKRHAEVVTFGTNWLKKFEEIDVKERDPTNLVFSMMDAQIPNKRIVDNINTIIQGGHDTSILPISMALREMAKRPEIQDKIYEEIKEVIGTDINAEINIDHLNNMPYLHATAKEAVRRFMSLPFLDRLVLRDMVIDGTKIPKGIQVMFHLTGIMTSEKNYDDPLTFKPERFMKENVTAQAQKSFIGFGYGVKSCPGKPIAYAAMKLILTKIIREFEVLPAEHDVQLVAEIFYRSVSGIPSTFRKRNIQAV
ncbi:cytochrome P450 4C1-like isoform X1 [Onthophagus taurus]|uniref:cytochrome P450 4C1-like isoform X1 n=2 Tax=Onthophagus taurus TaxID=166361 RepID=UPI0039BE490C